VKNEKPARITRIPHQIGPDHPSNLTDHELLEEYLASSAEGRDRQFPDTAGAAQIVGLSRRTIQLWIELGEIQAVLIGGKYRVSLDSLRAYLKRREAQRWR
jgi:excisionase family DNA binding protein